MSFLFAKIPVDNSNSSRNLILKWEGDEEEWCGVAVGAIVLPKHVRTTSPSTGVTNARFVRSQNLSPSDFTALDENGSALVASRLNAASVPTQIDFRADYGDFCDIEYVFEA